MVTPRPSAPLLEPQAPMWAQRFTQRLYLYFVSMWPQQPIQLWGVTKANLPQASEWLGCVVYVSDQKKLGISDGTIWRDAMGGAI